MLYLILTMLKAYNEFDNEINFEKFDIDNFISKYKILENLLFTNIKCNELGIIILWENKYLTNEEFAKLMGVEFNDNSFWLVCDNFDDILSNNYSFEIDILNGTFDWQPSDFYDVAIEPYWDDYTEKTLERIIKFCVNKGFEIDGELMTNENTNLIDGDIYFNDIKLISIIDDSDLEELKNSLNSAICEAQDSANYSECYNSIKTNFKSSIGEFKYKSKSDKDIEKLWVKLNIDWEDVKKNLRDTYGEYEFEETSFGNLYHVLNDMDFFNFKKPNYKYLDGDIDKNDLNEDTQNRLDWD